jgi:hypothetical protein
MQLYTSRSNKPPHNRLLTSISHPRERISTVIAPPEPTIIIPIPQLEPHATYLPIVLTLRGSAFLTMPSPKYSPPRHNNPERLTGSSLDAIERLRALHLPRDSHRHVKVRVLQSPYIFLLRWFRTAPQKITDVICFQGYFSRVYAHYTCTGIPRQSKV